MNNGSTPSWQLEELKKVIRKVYSQYIANAPKQRELALTAQNRGTPKKGFKKKFKGTCQLCGKRGHKSADCWENEKNKDKRPPNFKTNNDSNTNVAMAAKRKS